MEAEQGVLGCVLLDPTENIGLCVEKFRSGSDVFYDLRHRVLFELLVELFDKKQPIDIFTLSELEGSPATRSRRRSELPE